MNRPSGAVLLIWALMVFSEASAASPAGAETSGGHAISSIDVAEGDRLAHTLCVNCHVVDTHGPLQRTDRVPSFSWIAHQPGLTQDYLTVWLSTSRSHDRMPDFSLTRDEIRQLSAYIISLKNPDP
jgi:mono/diheme cytochrome c family protein